ncbi:helix-turn-helix domain-containing protein [Actinoplanes regularis]|uniref:Helix-turn-helix domain-containing protein n=1 Tax=Actinoplanes regularis TaxID=52697 RepID=A0A239BIK6_9ACTN|nr:helix-turn-helix transcriptional regulator [Actinoplanes regularis]GIE87991.1 transcriptional regulator [Actinoplanes regularis]SNS06944.1 Helix-turn-helix domain-containing protein [Actinoplanes regularis]
MSDIEGPTLRRRRLGVELKRCREAAHLTQQDVSRHFEWHSAKVTRIETARVAVTPRDVRDLLTLYLVEDEEYREALIELARSSRERSWWTDYKDIMRPGNFVGMEAAATSMRCWEPILIPGLLQTEAYMRALISTGRSADPPQRIDRRISLRLTRQSRLQGEHPLELALIVDESAIRRRIGGEDVMTAQLEHLIETAKLPNISLQVLPFSAGEHSFLGGPCTLLEYRDTTHLDVVYLEGLAGDYYEEQPTEVARYRQEFERLSTRALDHRTTIKMIESLLGA